MTISSTAIAGLRAAELRASVAAGNIANSGTKDYKALTVTQSAGADGGPHAKATYRDSSAVTTIDGEGNLIDTSNVNLDEELLQSQLAVNDFQANATALRVNRQLQGTLLDILA